MHGPIFGEFLGTLVLIMLGDGVVANVLLKGSKGENSGWIVITTGWGLAVLAGIITSVGVGGVAHLNPAVTLAAAVTGGDFSNVVPFIAAQMVGAFCGGALVWLIYLPHWAGTESQGLKLAVFCTGPAIRNIPSNALTEFLVTIALVVIGFAIGSKGFAGAGLPGGLGPYFWGMLVWGIGLSLGGPTGYAINPARDLGPRIAHAVLPIAGKGDSDWGYALVPVLAPAAGGIVGALICKATGIA
ncbi:aquaporin family protein [Siculibacillus lacustris]|uniref:Aquaporin family protein n=1 Tax=Siculibacillus lacustris TaxID=1549641 RepID=A0A4Q9VMF8_9HYPH|nr:MIP/aquaporin family protein [Siculibacillus lacustris]TBW36750.1 aquaporin family protein [Siculibacillus lacustris]